VAVLTVEWGRTNQADDRQKAKRGAEEKSSVVLTAQEKGSVLLTA